MLENVPVFLCPFATFQDGTGSKQSEFFVERFYPAKRYPIIRMPDFASSDKARFVATIKTSYSSFMKLCVLLQAKQNINDRGS